MKTQKSKASDRPTTYKADINVPAKGKAFARLVHVDLNEEETAQIQGLADRCKMTLDSFVRTYLTSKPAWDYSKPPKVKLTSLLIPRDLPKKHMDRLERAAALWDQSVLEFVADAINNNIVGAEDMMLLNPRTGELLGFNEPNDLLRRHEGPVPQPLPAAEPGGYSAIHNVAATQDDCGFEYRVALTKAEAQAARTIAKRAGMTLKAFIQADLEGAFKRDGLEDLDLPTVTKPLKLTITNTDTAARLQRVAEFCGKTVEEMLADEFKSHIQCFEDDWLFHPQTGKIIGDRLRWPTPGMRGSRITARPLSEQAQERKGGSR